MKITKNILSDQKGMGLFPIVAVVSILGFVGFAGYAVYQAGQNNSQINQISDYNVDDDGDLWIGNNTPLTGTVNAFSETEIANLIGELSPEKQAAFNAIEFSRVGGDSRFRTAIAVSQFRYPNAGTLTKRAVLVNGESYADAVSAASLSSTLGMPLLYVPSTIENGGFELATEVGKELGRLKTEEVYVVGGEAAVSTEMLNSYILDYARGESGIFPEVTRLAGDTRIQSSIEVAKRSGSSDTLFIANGYVEADSALFQTGYEKGGLVYINDPNTEGGDSLPGPVKDYIMQTSPSNIRILGGTSVITDNIKDEIQDLVPSAEILRIAGDNRYHTATALSQYLYPNGSDSVYLVHNVAESDAILANSLSLGENGPVLYVNQFDIPLQVAQELHRLNPSKIIVIGGEARISESVVNHAKAIASRAFDLDNLDGIQ